MAAVWDSDEAIILLKENFYKDYQIIGLYFNNKEYFFKDRSACLKEIKRNLRAAKSIKDYDIDDIKKTMKYLDDQAFENGWSLEAVFRYIDDCITTDFISDGAERTKLLNAI